MKRREHIAWEVKTFEVENKEEKACIATMQQFGWKLQSSQRIFNQTTRPTGAVTYENYTYIRSETNTIDFVRLVFERDTQMRNYKEIAYLESKYFDLLDICPSARPHPPLPVKDMEEWFKTEKPNPFSKIRSIFQYVIAYLVGNLFVTFLVMFVGTMEGNHFPFALSFALCAVYALLLNLGLSFGFVHAYRAMIRPVMLKSKAYLHNPTIISEYQKYTERYNLQMEKVNAYDQIQDQMYQILKDANRLMKNN